VKLLQDLHENLTEDVIIIIIMCLWTKKSAFNFGSYPDPLWWRSELPECSFYYGNIEEHCEIYQKMLTE